MSTYRPISAATRTALFAGFAVAGAAFWMAATTGPGVAIATPQVQLASIGSPTLSPAPTDCPTLLCSSLIGSQASAPTPGALFAALIGPSAAPSITSTGNPISALISVFVSDGTAGHPNAGLLIGNGYQGAAGQNGGNGGNGGLIDNGASGSSGTSGSEGGHGDTGSAGGSGTA